MAQAAAKGNISLTIEQNELEARLVFTPDKDGADWSSDKILKLALDAKLTTVNPKRAEDLVSKFARSKGSVTEVIAAGVAPEAPVPEAAEWAELPVPDELRDTVGAVLAEADAPVLHRVRIKTVRTEKKVTKPGALPFLPAKVEMVVVTDKIESREPVYPDAEVLSSGFARKGERLGLLSSAKPGKAGKSIFGKPIPFAGDSDSFILGRGVIRNKNELVADDDGIVRAGRTWVEIIPLATHRFSVTRASDGTTLVLDYLPGHARLPVPASSAVLEAAAKLGAGPGELVPEAVVAEALAKAAAAGQPLLSWPLSPDRDSEVRVDLSPDGVRATLTVLKGRGRGKPLDLAAVSAALKASGLKGIKNEELKKAVLDFYKGGEAELRGYILVEGKEPARGKDRAMSLAVSGLVKEKAAALRQRMAERDDLEKLVPSISDFPLGENTLLAFVSLGQKVGGLSAPDPGQPGMDIRGNVIPGLPGNDPVIRCFEGVGFAKGRVAAARTGLLMAEERSGAWCFRVVPFQDASLEAGVSPDGMQGTVTLRAEEGFGAGLDMESVIKAIGDRGIVFGLDPRAIAEAVADARGGKPVLNRVIATGKPAHPAGGTKVEWLVGDSPGGVAPAGVTSVSAAPNGARVKAGQELLRVTAVKGEGEQGCDVLGKVLLPAPACEDCAPPKHDGTVVEKEVAPGKRVFLAKGAGELLVADGKISIRDKLALGGDVGPVDGELRFAGSIEVGGSILTGAKLIAGGDIRVAGSIEAAMVSSEGLVKTGGGVKGARRGTIRAMRTLELSFAEQALLLAVEDIIIRGSCVLCNVKTNGMLSMVGGKASLVGGLIRARKGIEVETLGSANGVRTEVAFGQDYLVADMIDGEEREIEKVKSVILQSDRTMAELERAGAGLDQIRHDKVKLLKLLEKRSVRLFDFREKFEQHFPSEVRVRGTVFPGVILESHNRYFEVKSRKTGVAFSFDQSNGRIVERPLK